MNQQKSSGKKKKKSQISDSRGSGVEIAQPGVCLCVCSWGTRVQVGVHLEQALKLEAFLPEQ